ncbi:unnamed protein product [Linum trigynum]|uniref:Uncharacterized protein n=1 Tax=Linum trigynum TaxID=586398 RepID=A0AAV2EF65_9ROSI
MSTASSNFCRQLLFAIGITSSKTSHSEMGVFNFAGKAYMVGGETTGGLDHDFLSENWVTWENGVEEPSDRVYEFPNPPNGTLDKLPDSLRLPSPMRSPIVAKINGRVYLLHGDHCYMKPALPSDPSNCFVVLDQKG